MIERRQSGYCCELISALFDLSFGKNDETIQLMLWVWILLPLNVVIGHFRWSKGGRPFVMFQIGTGIAWIIYALVGFNSIGWRLRPDFMGILLLAASWTAARVRETRHRDAAVF